MTAKSDSKPYGLIYCITNLVNGKKYIGQTTGSLVSRWAAHCSEYSRCRAISSAIKEHGKDSFTVEEIAVAYSKDELNRLEVELISSHGSLHFEAGYNLTTGGNSYKPAAASIALMSKAKTGKKASEATKMKMSAARAGRKLSPEHCESIRKANLGKVLSEEHRVKLSVSHKGQIPSAEAIAKIVAKNTGKKRTAETCERISVALTGKKRGPHSEERKRQIGEKSLGKRHTDESKAKLSAAHAGKVLTQDHRAKLSEAKQALFADPVKRAVHLAKRRATFAAKKAAQI